MSESTSSSNYAHLDAEDDDDWEKRTPAQWMFDVLLIPGLILLLTTLAVVGSSAALWATFVLWASILAMIG